MKHMSRKWFRKTFEQTSRRLITTTQHRTCFPVSIRRYTGTSFHVPSAYRIYNSHFRNDSYRKNPYKKDSTPIITKEARKFPNQEDIRKLGRLENEAKSIIKLYAAALLPTINRQATSSSSDNNTTTNSTSSDKDDTKESITLEQLEAMTLSLQQSEDKYRHLCIKIRQLVAGWASFRTSSTYELSKYHKFGVNLSQLFKFHILEGNAFQKNSLETLESISVNSIHTNTVVDPDDDDDDGRGGSGAAQLNPSKRAEDYITLLDELRIHRGSMVQLALSEYYNYKMGHSLENSPTNDSFSQGIMKWMKTLFLSGSGLDTHTNLTTPVSRDISPASMRSSDPSQDPSARVLANLHGLKAHESSNFTSTVRLYKEVMKSYIHWHVLLAHETRSRVTSHQSESDEEDSNKERYWRFGEDRASLTLFQNESLANELDRLLESVKHICHVKKNINVLPDRDMYHIVMKQHARLGTYEGALRVIHLLHEMKETAKTLTTDNQHFVNDRPTASSIRRIRHGKSLDKVQDSTEIHQLDAYKPTLQSYCIALRACRNFVACPPIDNVIEKLKIVDRAQDLLLESESFRTSKVWIDGEDVTGAEADSDMAASLGVNGLESCDPTWSTRTITFSIMNLAGHKVVPDLCSRVDALMIKFIGEKAFLKLIGDDDSGPVSDVKVDLAICHLIIEIYNRKKDKRYAKRAKALLRSMEAMVKDSKWNSSGNYYPCTNTYNSVIKCMHLERTLENAEAATLLLDSMVRRQSSMPNRTTFNGILSLWSCSGSPQAGEKASAILARMEMHNMLQSEASTRPTVLSYELALKCWSLASFKGYPSAAKRAYGLLKSMEAQCSTLLLKEPFLENRLRGSFAQVYNNQLCPDPSVYSYVIYACSKTTNEDDKGEALQIAVNVYNSLIDRKLLPTKMLYLNLISCGNLVPETRSEQRKLLLERVIESMSDEFKSDVDITQALKSL